MKRDDVKKSLKMGLSTAACSLLLIGATSGPAQAYGVGWTATSNIGSLGSCGKPVMLKAGIWMSECVAGTVSGVPEKHTYVGYTAFENTGTGVETVAVSAYFLNIKEYNGAGVEQYSQNSNFAGCSTITLNPGAKMTCVSTPANYELSIFTTNHYTKGYSRGTVSCSGVNHGNFWSPIVTTT